MIIISVGGGLGNQMFEYAFYETMKKKYPNQTIKLDIMNLYKKEHNGYELERIFGLKAEECEVREIKKLVDKYPVTGKNYKFWNLIFKIRRKVLGSRKSFLTQGDGSEYSEKFFELDEKRSYYCLGVFANYKYFIENREYIKKLYRFPEITDEKNKLLQEEIVNGNSVSIHIRRGDYVKLGLDIMPEKYYRDAMELIEKKVGSCTYYVFTDDVEYVRENYSDITNLVIVEGNKGKDSFRDMQLMSLCKHNIIANSTFSFWGAFLNDNKEKIVVAPKQPFTGCKYPFACADWVLM